jgi:hypothetical protein
VVREVGWRMVIYKGAAESEKKKKKKKPVCREMRNLAARISVD